MKLNQISIIARFDQEKTREFNIEAWAIAEQFWSNLKLTDNKSVQKCNIQVYDQDSIFPKGEIKKIGSIAYTYIEIDIKEYFKLSDKEKKLLLLNIVSDGMQQIASIEKWNIDEIKEAYNRCLAQNLNYYFFIKNKFKSSPDRKFKIGLWCEWELKSCKMYGVIFSKKNELKRFLIWELRPYAADVIYYLDWKWQDNSSIIISNSRNEIVELISLDL